MKAMGKIARLKPEYVELYTRLHENCWPEVRAALVSGRIAKYEIYIMDNLVFTYMEYSESDISGDETTAPGNEAESEVMKKWLEETNPCFDRFAFGEEFETTMKNIFSL